MEVIFIRQASLVLIGFLVIFAVAVPMAVAESHDVHLKKHFGPVPFPENLIPHPHGAAHDNKVKDIKHP